MIKIIAYIYNDETDIERDDCDEIIICEERVYKISDIREIIKYHWGLDSNDYELTTILEEV